MTGFTLPGMIDDPGWRAGSRISAKPVRGPDDISSRSSQDLGEVDGETAQGSRHREHRRHRLRGLDEMLCRAQRMAGLLRRGS